jgi:NAD(P)H-flavin reductase
MLYVLGAGEAPVSICSDPANTKSVCHPPRGVGVVTRAMNALKPGDVGSVIKMIPQARAVWYIQPHRADLRSGSDDALQHRGSGDENIFVSMGRNIKCGLGFCGHCQFGPYFICKDGPIFRYDRIAPIFRQAEA